MKYFNLTHAYQRLSIRSLLAKCDLIDRLDAPPNTIYIVTILDYILVGKVINEYTIKWAYGNHKFNNLFDAVCWLAEIE